MKTVHIIIGILTLMVFTVSNASAFPINTLNIPGDEPVGTNIQVDVTYNAVNNQIIYMVDSTGLSDPRITEIAYNLPNEATITAYDINGNQISNEWNGANTQFSTFGTFEHVYKMKSPNTNAHPHRVVAQLTSSPDFDGTIPGTYQVAAHFIWDSPAALTGATSIKVAGGNGGSAQIPEFPSMALPIAAIVGIMFIFGRRRKE
ncbi:PEF-CTERM sorting domain-containing protein [Methanosarcina sp.]|uniref:PEF-CTERM sorting domain-containing protein n=1 Tax=Methanosarcina sp. TaxID=2213 RepID=UPI003BB700C6